MNLKKKFVIGAASLALVAGMGVAPAMAAVGDDIVLPGGQTFSRLSGESRFETAKEIAKHAKASGAAYTKVYLVAADALPCKTAYVLRRGKPGWQISAGVRRTRVVNQRRGAVTEIS